MKRFTVFLAVIAINSITAIISSQEVRDTIVEFNKKHIYIRDSIGQIRISVKDKNSENQYKKVYEGLFTDDKSYEKFNVMQEISFYMPFMKKKHRHERNYIRPKWAGFGFGFLTLGDCQMNIGYSGGIPLNKNKSNEIILNIMEGVLPLGYSQFGITSGFGLNWRNLHIENNKHILETNGITEIHDAPAGITYNYSRLRTLHLTIPLLIEWQPRLFNNNHYNKFYLNTGIIAGWNVMASYRIKYEDTNGNKINKVESRGLQTNPLTLDCIVQVGYGTIGFYAKYSPVGVFQKDKGPKVNFASLGCIVNF